MANEALLSRMPIPETQVHRISSELPDANTTTRAYEAALHAAGAPPIDLVLLGIEPNEHTASLFPDTTALDEHEHLVMPVPTPPAPAPGPTRLTLTLPALNATREVVFL